VTVVDSWSEFVSEIVEVGRTRVFRGSLTVSSCSLLSFGVEIKFHLNRKLEYTTI
jgi:hypothetical protein